jgi:hypothetical protein
VSVEHHPNALRNLALISHALGDNDSGLQHAEAHRGRKRDNERDETTRDTETRERERERE